MPVRVLNKQGDTVVFAKRSPSCVHVVTWFPRWRSLGLSLHRTGGMSLIGVPREGGTTVVWGRKLKHRMAEHAMDCSVVRLGPLMVYSGEDF